MAQAVITFLNSPWAPATAGFIAAQVLIPLIRLGIARLRGRFGPFSGTYVAITGDLRWRAILGAERYLVEIVQIRQVHARIVGRLLGYATLEENGGAKRDMDNAGNYALQGSVTDRLLTLTYRPTSAKVRSTGVVALIANDSGDVFGGQWTGSVHDGLVTLPCVWLRVPKTFITERNRVIAFAWQFIESMTRAVLDPKTHVAAAQAIASMNEFRSFKGTGKSMLLIPRFFATRKQPSNDNEAAEE